MFSCQTETIPVELRESPIQKPSQPNSPLIMPDVTEIKHEVPLPSTQVDPSPPIDLLNLNQPSAQAQMSADSQSTAMPSSDASFDLLGAFGDDVSSGIGSAPIPDILGKLILFY